MLGEPWTEGAGEAPAALGGAAEAGEGSVSSAAGGG